MELTLAAKSDRRSVSTQSADFKFIFCMLASVWFAIAVLNSAHASEITLETRTNLQLALKQYIDAGTVDGIYDHFNVEKGQVEKLRLKTLHPVIFAIDSKYMMCADFLDAAGNDVLVDYIVGASASGFRIEHEIPGRRSYLQQFFERLD